MKKNSILFSILKKLEEILLKYTKNKNKYLILKNLNLHHIV